MLRISLETHQFHLSSYLFMDESERRLSPLCPFFSIFLSLWAQGAQVCICGQEKALKSSGEEISSIFIPKVPILIYA